MSKTETVGAGFDASLNLSNQASGSNEVRLVSGEKIVFFLFLEDFPADFFLKFLPFPCVAVECVVVQF